MKTARLVFLAAAFSPVVSLAALAPEVEPVMMDDVAISSDLKVGASYDDNYYTEPAGAQNSTMLYTVAPGVTLLRGDDDSFGKLVASAVGGIVSENSHDNFVDADLALSGRNLVSDKSALEGAFGFHHGHDERGRGNTEGCSVDGSTSTCDTEPDIYNLSYLKFGGQYGLGDSRGQLTGAVTGTRKNYTNNEPRTLTQDYYKLGLDGGFAWKVGGRTQAVIDLGYGNYNYDIGSGDSQELNALAGVAWDIAGKTSGHAKAGMGNKNFAAPGRKDLSNILYNVGLDWTPTEYSGLNLEFVQTFQESDVVGVDAILADRWSARYFLQFADRLEPWVRYTYMDEVYKGSTREDETTTLDVGVDYKFRPRIVFGLLWTTVTQSSTAGGGIYDYDRNVISLNGHLAL